MTPHQSPSPSVAHPQSPEMPAPGKGWTLLAEGTPLQPGDGFMHPDMPGAWIDFDCRPDKFRGCGKEGMSYFIPKNDTAHSWPWRRRTTPTQPTGGEQAGTEHTATPWTLGRHGSITGGVVKHYVNGSGRDQLVMVCCVAPENEGTQKGNAAFIVGAVNSHAQNLATIAELRQERDDLKIEAQLLKLTNDKRIDEFLNAQACCNGVDCGCRGITRLQQMVGEEAGTTIAEQQATIGRMRAALEECDRQRIELMEGVCQAISMVGTHRDEFCDEDPPEMANGSPEYESLQNLRGHLEGTLIDGKTGEHMERDAFKAEASGTVAPPRKSDRLEKITKAAEQGQNTIRSLIHTLKTIDSDECGKAREERRSACVHTNEIRQAKEAHAQIESALNPAGGQT